MGSEDRRKRLAELAERAIDIYDETVREALAGGDVPRYCLVTSEGSPESSYADNPNITLYDSRKDMAAALVGEISEGWIPNGGLWDLETGATLGYEIHATISAPPPSTCPDCGNVTVTTHDDESQTCGHCFVERARSRS